MKFDLLALLAISLAAMFFGYYFGLFEGRGQGYKRRKNEEERDGAAGTTAGLAAADRDPALLRLGHEETGDPTLVLDGNRVDGAKLSAEQRKRLIELMLVMRPWVEATPLPAEVSPALAPAPAMPDRLHSGAGTAVPAAAPAPVINRQMSIVGQIDAVLQLRLAGTALASLGVRLVDSAEGGVTVVVGKDKYAAVGDVPQPEVQAAIRGAIAEWEEKYAPG
jgi:hypothetical protein